MIKKTIGLFCLSCSALATAGTMGETPKLPAFYIGAFGGYGQIDGTLQGGDFSQARLSLGIRAPQAYKNVLLGAEIAVQSGNTMQLYATDEVIALAGDLPIQATLKPLLDILATAKLPLYSSFDLILKGGIAYRQLQLNSVSSPQDSLSKVNGEFQAGLSYPLSEHAQLTAMYQGIYSTSNANVQFTSTSVSNFFSLGDVSISNIPTQQAGFLGIEYTF